MDTKQQNKFSERLAKAALLVWVIACLLPGFSCNSQDNPYYGIIILLMGIPLGWLVNGWAVYANLFFIFVYLRVMANKRPIASVFWMLCLAATLPLFKGVLRDEGTGVILSVTAWGWGALLWLISLIMLSCAALVQRQSLSKKGVGLIYLGLAVVIASGLMIHQQQWQQANDQEREAFLKNMVFMTMEPCGVPFVWPDKQLIADGQPVRVEIDPVLQTRNDKKRPYFYLPKLNNYMEGNYEWITYPLPGSYSAAVKVRQLAQDNRPVLQAVATSDGAKIRILDETKKVLFEQELKIKSFQSGEKYYCPFEHQQQSSYPQSLIMEGWDTAILKALGQDLRSKNYPTDVRLKPEFANISCDVGNEDVEGVKYLREWDGRQVMYDSQLLYRASGFCSDNYMALVKAFRQNPENIKVSLEARVFDRKTFKPMARFGHGYGCAYCSDVAKSSLLGVQIEANQVTLKTTHGDFSAPMRR